VRKVANRTAFAVQVQIRITSALAEGFRGATPPGAAR
jgi:hypothetical protein